MERVRGVFVGYYGACVEMSPSEGRCMESKGKLFMRSHCSGLPPLPFYTPANKESFIWSSSVIGDLFSECISKAYDTSVHWHPNLFSVPHGRMGTLFISELSKLFNNYSLL